MKTAGREDAAYIIGNDAVAAKSLEKLFDSINIEARVYSNPLEFLRSYTPDKPCCIIMEMRMPRLNGLELLAQLNQRRAPAPAIVVTAYGEVSSAVRAMKLGAVDFLEKPINEEILLECAQQWINVHRTELERMKQRTATETKLESLSPREREVLLGLLSGKSNKEIANGLDITPKAIELYRSKLMSKMAAPSLAALIHETLCSSVCGSSQCCASRGQDGHSQLRRGHTRSLDAHEASVQLIKSSQYAGRMRKM
jgi:two-component system, LuxR family, response regulator FixJ